MADLIHRIRPGRRFVMPATANNLPLPGDVINFDFGAGASAQQIFRYNVAGKFPLVEQYVSVKTTALVHIAFGALDSIVDPTAANARFEPGDSWQDWDIFPEDVAFKTFGYTGGGNLQLIFSSR